MAETMSQAVSNSAVATKAINATKQFLESIKNPYASNLKAHNLADMSIEQLTSKAKAGDADTLFVLAVKLCLEKTMLKKLPITSNWQQKRAMPTPYTT